MFCGVLLSPLLFFNPPSYTEPPLLMFVFSSFVLFFFTGVLVRFPSFPSTPPPPRLGPCSFTDCLPTTLGIRLFIITFFLYLSLASSPGRSFSSFEGACWFEVVFVLLSPGLPSSHFFDLDEPFLFFSLKSNLLPHPTPTKLWRLGVFQSGFPVSTPPFPPSCVRFSSSSFP